MLRIETAIPMLRQWAEANPYISKLWIFGSYAKGNAKDDSDLDIAVEIIIPAVRRDNENVLAVYISEKDTWKKELQKLLSFEKVQIEYLDAKETPTVKNGVQEANILAYCRTCMTIEVEN